MRELDEALWYSCSEATNTAACKLYVELLPNGNHADSAQKEVTVAEAREAEATREREKKRAEQQAKEAAQKKALALRHDTSPVPTTPSKTEAASRRVERLTESTKSMKEKCAERIASDGGYNPRNEVHRLCVAEMAK